MNVTTVLEGARPETVETDVTEILEAYMVDGGTVQIHLGPYRNEYQPNRLPYGMDIAMRNQWNNTVTYEDLVIVDAYHPLMSNVDTAAFAGSVPKADPSAEERLGRTVAGHSLGFARGRRAPRKPEPARGHGPARAHSHPLLLREP